MKRRDFLQAAGTITAATAVGGVFWGRALAARSRLSRHLIAQASPILVEKEHNEISELPDAASEEMKLWFTGACLNSAQFIDNICSEGFAARLGQFNTDREKEMCVANEFLARVISHSAIYQRIELVAKETGAVLDQNWKSCCDQIADKWQMKLAPKSEDLADELHARLDLLISAELDEEIAHSVIVADRPSAISSAIGIGNGTIMLMPLVTLPSPFNAVVIPAFALVAITHLARYVMGILFQNASAAKHAISDRVALLGNRVAAEFDSALKTRIADLHTWQNNALRTAAGEYAHEAIGII